MVFQSILHLRFEDQYKQMLNAHENVVNLFTYYVSVCMNFCLDLQIYKLISHSKVQVMHVKPSIPRTIIKCSYYRGHRSTPVSWFKGMCTTRVGV